ncbi:MAG: hypothetical protein WC441_01405 [Patescibacteria group bacterium]
MDKIAKVLNKLIDNERKSLEIVLLKIKNNSLVGLDVKKLKGREDIFRVRKGKIRVIFQENYDGIVKIISVERRSDKTYKNF